LSLWNRYLRSQALDEAFGSDRRDDQRNAQDGSNHFVRPDAPSAQMLWYLSRANVIPDRTVFRLNINLVSDYFHRYNLLEYKEKTIFTWF
jgi:hypothetical protein